MSAGALPMAWMIAERLDVECTAAHAMAIARAVAEDRAHNQLHTRELGAERMRVAKPNNVFATQPPPVRRGGSPCCPHKSIAAQIPSLSVNRYLMLLMCTHADPHPL